MAQQGSLTVSRNSKDYEFLGITAGSCGNTGVSTLSITRNEKVFEFLAFVESNTGSYGNLNVTRNDKNYDFIGIPLMCDDPEEEGYSNFKCYNLGATPVSFYATYENFETSESSIIDLKEDLSAHSTSYKNTHNLSGPATLNIKNITQVITEGGQFIDTDYVQVLQRTGFSSGSLLAPDSGVIIDDNTTEYAVHNLLANYGSPTFDSTYECQRYPSKVRSDHWGTNATVIDQVGKTRIEIGLYPVDDDANRRFRHKKDSDITPLEAFDEYTKGSTAHTIVITDLETGRSLRWVTNKAKKLTVDHPNELYCKTPDVENNSGAIDTWTITETKIEAKLHFFKLGTGGSGVYFTNSAHRQGEAPPSRNPDDFSVAGYYDISIDLSKKDVFSVLARRFYINLIYEISEEDNCQPEIRVEDLIEDNTDGFTDTKNYIATEDDLNTYDFQLGKYSFLEQSFNYKDIDLTNLTNLGITDQPDMVRVYGIEVATNLNWLRNLQDNQVFRIKAKGEENCPSSFRVIISSVQITDFSSYLYAIQDIENPNEENDEENDEDIEPVTPQEVYAEGTFDLPKEYEDEEEEKEKKVAEIRFNRDRISIIPT